MFKDECKIYVKNRIYEICTLFEITHHLGDPLHLHHGQ